MLKIIPVLVLLLISGNAVAVQTAAQNNDTPSISDARALIEQGRDNDAIGALVQRVESSPENFQAWFMLGVIQAKQRRFHDAVISFGKVVSLQPKLAEPHNNLAVIYNELGDFRAAVKELEASLKLKPDYATAHENIGDLYVKLAADAYRKALGTDSRPALRQRYERLLHIRDTHKPGQPEIAVDQQAVQTAKAAIELPSAGAQERPQAETVSEAKASEVSEQQASLSQSPDRPLAGGQQSKQQSEQQPHAATAPAVVSDTEKQVIAQQATSNNEHQVKPVIKANIHPGTPFQTAALHVNLQDSNSKQAALPGRVNAPGPQGNIKAAMTAVEAWRSAWNRQDVPAYFAAYSDTFDFGTRFETLKQWKHYKQWVITKRAFIRVTLENIEAKLLPKGEIRLVFLQHFRSDSFNSDDIKTMVLRQTMDGWKIIHEASQ